MTLRMVWRKALNAVMLSLTGVCALITVSALVVILGFLAWNGGDVAALELLHKSARTCG